MPDPLDQLFNEFQEAVEDSYADFRLVRRWKEENDCRALGYFPVYFPEELAHSMALLPVNLLGASGRLRLDTATAHTQSFVCSISRSVFQLAKQGALDIFDALIFSNICDVARNLSGIVKRNLGPKYVDYIHYPINNTSAYAIEYLKEEYLRISMGLEKLTGVPLRADKLRKSIKLYNQKRKLQMRLIELRRRKPWLISYPEYYILLRAGGLMPVERYVGALSEYLARAEERVGKPMDKIRVAVLGNFCEQPPVMLMKVIEDAGCYIVYDEAMVGSRWIGLVEEDEDDPLLALARAYVKNLTPLTVRYHPAIDKRERMAMLVRETNAEGVIFCTPKFCEPALYDYIIYRLALEKLKIPCLHLEYEESSSSFEHARTMVETFAESILFD